MKPCSKNRKLIAWLALDALEARKAATLRDHLALCQGCRRYWEEISSVTERLASAKPDSNPEASEFFHRQVIQKLQAVESKSVLENLVVWLPGSVPNWRIAVSVIAVLVVALFAMVLPRPHPTPSPPTTTPVLVMSESNSGSELSPTLANYQMIANQSLEKLDALLTQQGNKRLPPAPVYAASGLQLANAPF